MVVMPPPVRGIGTSGGFRMMLEDRAGAGPQALQGAVYAMMGRAAETPGPHAGILVVRGIDAAALSRHRSHQGAVAWCQHVRRVRCAADVSGLHLRQRLQSAGPRVPRHCAGGCRISTGCERRAQIRVRNTSGETVPLGSFTTVRDVSGPYRVPRYNLYPAAELDGAPAPGFSQGQAIADHGEAGRETLPPGLQL